MSGERSEFSQLPQELTELYNNWRASDDLLIANDTAVSTNNGNEFLKKKEIKLIRPVLEDSTFRIAFDMQRTESTGTMKAQLKINGVNVGSEQTTTSTTYVTKTQDISNEYPIDCTIELWIKSGSHTWYNHARNFRIYGIRSPFENTLGA